MVQALLVTIAVLANILYKLFSVSIFMMYALWPLDYPLNEYLIVGAIAIAFILADQIPLVVAMKKNVVDVHIVKTLLKLDMFASIPFVGCFDFCFVYLVGDPILTMEAEKCILLISLAVLFFALHFVKRAIVRRCTTRQL